MFGPRDRTVALMSTAADRRAAACVQFYSHVEGAVAAVDYVRAEGVLEPEM